MTVGELKELLNSYSDDNTEIFIGERSEWCEEYITYKIDFAVEDSVADWREGFYDKMKIHENTFLLVKGCKVGSNMLEWKG